MYSSLWQARPAPSLSVGCGFPNQVHVLTSFFSYDALDCPAVVRHLSASICCWSLFWLKTWSKIVTYRDCLSQTLTGFRRVFLIPSGSTKSRGKSLPLQNIYGPGYAFLIDTIDPVLTITVIGGNHAQWHPSVWWGDTSTGLGFISDFGL